MKTVVLAPSSFDLPPGWSGQTLRDEIQRAADRWSYPNVPCAVKVTVAEPASVRSAARDGINLVAHRQRSWCHNERCGAETTFPFRTTGMTTVYPKGATGTSVQEADVELNGVAFQFTGPSIGDGGAGAGVSLRWSVPLEPVLIHEIGHVLGLGDACLAGHRPSGRPVTSDCGADEKARAMFPTGLHVSVAPGDVAELCQLYPPEAHGLSGRAAVAGAGIVFLAFLVLAAVLILRRFKPRSG